MSPQNCLIAAPARSLWRYPESPIFCPSYKATSNIQLASRKSLHSAVFSAVESRSAMVRIDCPATKDLRLPNPIFGHPEKWIFWNFSAPGKLLYRVKFRPFCGSSQIPSPDGLYRFFGPSLKSPGPPRRYESTLDALGNLRHPQWFESGLIPALSGFVRRPV